MVCFLDMTFCSDAEQCANKETCNRWLSPELQEKAVMWWGGEDFPVAFSPFKTDCKDWRKSND